MPEARDRLSRHDDQITYTPRRRSIALNGNAGRGDSVILVAEDRREGAGDIGSPFRWRNIPLTGTAVPSPGHGSTRGGHGTPRIHRRRNVNALPTGQENVYPMVGRRRGGSRGRQSVLPSWYPRTPLQDITSVVRAIDRRSRLRQGEIIQTRSPILQENQVHFPFLSTPNAQVDPNSSLVTPKPTIRASRLASIGKVPKLLLDIADENGHLTPEKLMNSIDKVQKAVMEELDRLKRTPSARKAEREKKVRTLMSMR